MQPRPKRSAVAVRPGPSSDPAYDTLALFKTIMARLDDIHMTLAGTRKDYYTVDEIAALVGRSAYTIRRWVAEKRIHATRVSGTGPKGRLLIPRDQVAVLIAAGLGEDIPGVAVPTER